MLNAPLEGIYYEQKRRKRPRRNDSIISSCTLRSPIRPVHDSHIVMVVTTLTWMVILLSCHNTLQKIIFIQQVVSFSMSKISSPHQPLQYRRHTGNNDFSDSTFHQHSYIQLHDIQEPSLLQQTRDATSRFSIRTNVMMMTVSNVNENLTNLTSSSSIPPPQLSSLPKQSPLLRQNKKIETYPYNNNNINNNKYQRQREIPPTELQIQQLKQQRQEAYEKICGPSTSILYTNDNDNSSVKILIDTGATYNKTMELVTIASTTTTEPTITSLSSSSQEQQLNISDYSNLNRTSPSLSSSILVLENVLVQIDNVTNTTTVLPTTTITSSINSNITATTTSPSSRKKKPASIWSFESLFPEPVLDTESIEKDLSYRNQILSNTIMNKVNNSNITSTLPSSPISSNNNIPKQQPESIINSRPIKDTFLYGGSAILRKEKAPKQPTRISSIVDMNQNNATINDNNNTNNNTGKVDPLLTRMVEDRVYGYRRLPTGDIQYETSLMNPDNAIQFRDGIRLGNPLPINADILSYLAKKELQHGRIDEACELYEKAVMIDPADGRAYLGLSKCAERRRDFTLARKWLVQGINRSVSMQQSRNSISTSTSSGSSTNAKSSSSTIPSKKNTSTRNNNNNNDKSDDTTWYTDTTTLVPDRGANPYLLQALGCLEEKLGQLTQAETYYAEAVKSRPYHTAAWVSLAVLRTRKLGYPVRVGRECYQCAERELQIANQPPSSYIYTSWANLEYHKANDKNRARELFQKAIQIDPQCSAAWLQLGVLEVACENWDDAERCFETVLKYDQRNTRVLQAYAIMETKRPFGDSRKAIGLFERAIQTNPRDAGIYQPYALYVAELGDLNMARSLLQKGTQVNKRHAPVWQAWGVLETRYGDPDTARNIFQEGIWSCGQLSGSQSGGYHCDRLWQAWGILEAKEGEYAAARRCFSRALDANNRNVPAFTAWALMEEQLGNINDARIIFERGLRKFSTGSEEKKALYRSYELMEQRLGDTKAAQNIYQRSVRESFDEKDDIDVLKSSSVLTMTSNNEEMNDNADATFDAQKVPKKKTKEFEVVRWESTGGEVWLNDRSIETKVSMKTKKSIPLLSRKHDDNDDTLSE
jgi:tetratricopeptide (TPR) repeat protein